MRLDRRVLLLILMVIFLIVAMAFFQFSTTSNAVIFEGGLRVAVDVADTPEKRTRGLSGRPELAQNEGMLFIFPETEEQSFWMKDMLFSIDIIWIGEDLKIKGVSANLPPCHESQCEIYPSSEAIRYVLEVNAGFAEENFIEIGDSVVLRV